jgi:hypothetical protein
MPCLLALPMQVVNITVINQLETSTLAIHWHGISQRGSPWSDGADQVTQCGIPPGGGAYSYVFKPDQVGDQGACCACEECWAVHHAQHHHIGREAEQACAPFAVTAATQPLLP